MDDTSDAVLTGSGSHYVTGLCQLHHAPFPMYVLLDPPARACGLLLWGRCIALWCSCCTWYWLMRRYSAYHHSHPPLVERLYAIDAAAKKAQ